MMKGIKNLLGKANKKTVAAYVSALTVIGSASSAFAAPNTGNTDVDSFLTTMESGFGTAQSSFTYLAIAAIPVTLIVVLFFWLRGKFKQAVSGA